MTTGADFESQAAVRQRSETWHRLAVNANENIIRKKRMEHGSSSNPPRIALSWRIDEHAQVDLRSRDAAELELEWRRGGHRLPVLSPNEVENITGTTPTYTLAISCPVSKFRGCDDVLF